MTDTTQHPIEIITALCTESGLAAAEVTREIVRHMEAAPAAQRRVWLASVHAYVSTLPPPPLPPSAIGEHVRLLVHDAQQAITRRTKMGVTRWTGTHALEILRDTVNTMRTLAVRGGRHPDAHLTPTDLQHLRRAPWHLIRAVLALIEEASPAILNAATNKTAARDDLHLVVNLMTAITIPILAETRAKFAGEFWDGPAEVERWQYSVDPYRDARSLLNTVFAVCYAFRWLVTLAQKHAPDSNPNAAKFLSQARALDDELTATVRRVWWH